MQKRMNIQEDLNVELNPFTVQNLGKLQESAKDGTPDKIITVVEAIHSGMTKNMTFYPAQNLEKSVDSWTRPYNKPVIKNHNTYEEPVGRVIAAEYKQSQIAGDKQTIQLTLEITDPETIRKVLDGRYQTLSIGGSTNSAICSVCGKDLVKENYCGHMKGRTYDGKQAHWIIGEMEFDEISWVNVPADANAQVIQKNAAAVKPKESATEGGQNMPVENQTEDLLNQIDGLRTQESQDNPETPENPATQTENEQTPETPAQQAEGAPEGTPETPAQPTLEEQLKTANDRIAALESEVETLKGEKKGLADQVDTLTTEKATLTDSVDTLKQEIAVAETENKSLLKQNIGLAGLAHKTLAESVAQLSIVLGKADTEEAQTALRESLAKESARTLQEKAAELAKERPVRIVQHVSVADAGDLTPESASPGQTQESKEITIKDLAERLEKVFNKQNQ